MRFTVQNNQLFRFLRTSYAISFVTLGALMLVIPIGIMIAEGAATQTIWIVIGGLIALGIGIFALTLWHASLFTKALSYEAKDGILYISEGVFVFERKAIPLDRVTDFRLVQGMLMRWFGLWKIHVQTAGAAGAVGAEGTLLAVQDPIAVRDQLLKLRDVAVKGELVENGT